MRTRTIVVAAVACAALPSPALGAAEPPDTLSIREAKILTRDAFEREVTLSSKRPRDVSCKRRSRLKVRCRTRGSAGFGTASVSVLITRSGREHFPIDTYRMTKYERAFGDTTKSSASGRFIVETRRAPIGETLRLLGNEDEEVEITVGDPVDPLFLPSGEFGDEPAFGHRYVGMVVTVRNVGRDRFERSVFFQATGVRTDGETARERLVTGCEDSLKIGEGETRRACMVFEVPFGTGLRQVEFDAGRETGVWEVLP